MDKRILEIINFSNNTNSKKNELIGYARVLLNNGVPIIWDITQISLMFQLEDKININYFINENTNSYLIEKKNGKIREVCQPNDKLKTIQKWVLRNILEKITISEYAHGFVKGKSIVSNAKIHIHEDKFWVLSLDIENFFSCIKKEQIKKIFIKLGYSDEVSEVFCSLCTKNNVLAQGFSSSPYISNIFMRSIDEELSDFALRKGIRYSRYADDITFSGEKFAGYKHLSKKVFNFVQYVLQTHNLAINSKKTRFMYKNDDKKITGILVRNNRLIVPTNITRKLDKEIYYCSKYGINSHLKYHNLELISNYKGYLYGTAHFIYMVEENKGLIYLKKLDELDWD